MKATDKVRRFMFKPRKGQIIKVYAENNKILYGIAQKIITTDKKVIVKNEVRLILSEVLLVKPTNREFVISEIDFFLDKNKGVII